MNSNSSNQKHAIRRKAQWRRMRFATNLAHYAPTFPRDVVSNIFGYVGHQVRPNFGAILCDDLYARTKDQYDNWLNNRKTRFIQRIADSNPATLWQICHEIYNRPITRQNPFTIRFNIGEMIRYRHLLLTGVITQERHDWWMNACKEWLVLYIGKLKCEIFADPGLFVIR